MSEPIMNDRTKSIIPRKPAMMKTATMTTSVDPKTSLRPGHVTFLVSAWTSCKKAVAFSIYARMTSLSQAASQHAGDRAHGHETGQEGFEPPTPGFGVRCSSRSSYWPVSCHQATCSAAYSTKALQPQELSCFAMNCMLSAEATVFLPLESIWGGAFVLHSRIVPLATVIAS
jgi:hypothetical protein